MSARGHPTGNEEDRGHAMRGPGLCTFQPTGNFEYNRNFERRCPLFKYPSVPRQ